MAEVMIEKVISFHGDKKVKAKPLKRLRAHYKADEIIKGKYWENGKGCAIGCAVHTSSNPHDAYQEEFGISWRLALLQDGLFEKLPNGQAKEFPIQFTEATTIGVDTDLVFKKFILWTIADEKDGLIRVIKDPKQNDLLQRIANLYQESYTREIAPEEWNVLAKEANKLSAYAYAYTSAYAYAYTSAYASTYASAYAYAYAYAYASASAYASTYASAYASPEWQKIFNERILLMRDKLLQFLKEAK